MANERRNRRWRLLGGEDNDDSEGAEEGRGRWGKRLVASKRFQRQYSADWDENRRLIFSEIPARSAGTGTRPRGRAAAANQVAYGWGLYEGLETSIYVQNPDVIASRPRRRLEQPIARRVTRSCKYDFDQMNVKDVGNLCLLDTFICGYGAVIEAWRPTTRRTRKGRTRATSNGQEFEIRRIAPLDILFDRGATRLDLSDCKYLFTAWYPTIEQLRNDPNITDLPTTWTTGPEWTEFTRVRRPRRTTAAERQALAVRPAGAGGEKDPAYRQVCVWEVYDKINHELLYLSDYKHASSGRAEWPVNLRFGCRDLFPQTLLYSAPGSGAVLPAPGGGTHRPAASGDQHHRAAHLGGLAHQVPQVGHASGNPHRGPEVEDHGHDRCERDALRGRDEATGRTRDHWNDGPGRLGHQNVSSSPSRTSLPRRISTSAYQMLEKEIQHIVGYGPPARGGLPSTRSAREAMMINQRQDAAARQAEEPDRRTSTAAWRRSTSASSRST